MGNRDGRNGENGEQQKWTTVAVDTGNTITTRRIIESQHRRLCGDGQDNSNQRREERRLRTISIDNTYLNRFL